MAHFYINDRKVGDDAPPLVVAEIGINHGGSLDVALEMAQAAIDSGVEIIKHQTHIPDDEMSVEARSVIPGNSSKSIYQIIDECSLSEEEEFELKRYIESAGVMFISTPFSRLAAERIHKMNLPAIKIGSGECNNYPLIKLVSKLGKPVILSTGMHSIKTVIPAVEILRSAQIPFALMHCTNLYPTPEKLIRLGGISELQRHFPDAVIGLSDHSLTNYPAIASVALGAKIIERHFTDTKERVGPDIPCSMDRKELKDLIEACIVVDQASGGGKTEIEEEQVTRNFAFASVVSTRDIESDEILTEENIWVKRPSGGDFTAEDYDRVLGQVARNRILANTQIKRSDLV
jgi:N-acetylneuraminate synthase